MHEVDEALVEVRRRLESVKYGAVMEVDVCKYAVQPACDGLEHLLRCLRHRAAAGEPAPAVEHRRGGFHIVDDVVDGAAFARHAVRRAQKHPLHRRLHLAAVLGGALGRQQHQQLRQLQHNLPEMFQLPHTSVPAHVLRHPAHLCNAARAHSLLRLYVNLDAQGSASLVAQLLPRRHRHRLKLRPARPAAAPPGCRHRGRLR
mmetsp:Transcript_31563/g.80895  ORF Transcript_31563/g.80895 Transcript_31563/m.80895 type:complete len:202 (-) Transcript_31563:262-867(-)